MKERVFSLPESVEGGEAQIRVFCQQYTAYSTANTRRAIEQLEREIREVESVSARNIEQSES